MAKALQRTPIPGPAFIRLLASLANAPVESANTPLSARLSEWLDWSRAVALSKALDGRLPAHDAGPPASATKAQEECERVHATLVETISRITGPVPAPSRKPAFSSRIDPLTPVEFTAFRERYRDLQQTIQAEVGRLRGNLRDILASISVDSARLAEVDAVMEMTLTPREHALLGSVSAVLAEHFERLRDLAGASQEALGPMQAAAHPPWLARFRSDMRDVLLAELDLRFQPVEGLLSVLRNQ